MTFSEEIRGFSWENIEDSILKTSPRDVESALASEKILFTDLMALLSPAAEQYLEALAQIAHRITVKRFGRVIQMYAPLYVSSECTNSCVYCGFNRHNNIERATLTIDEVIAEAKALHTRGFRHLLLVSGESPRHVPIEYLLEIANELSPMFSSLSIEVYPMDVKAYATLAAAGVDGLTIYQETYRRTRYKEVHPMITTGDSTPRPGGERPGSVGSTLERFWDYPTGGLKGLIRRFTRITLPGYIG
jgi:2-iminoacetate synthase